MVQVGFVGNVGFGQSQVSKISFVSLVNVAGKFYSGWFCSLRWQRQFLVGNRFLKIQRFGQSCFLSVANG